MKRRRRGGGKPKALTLDQFAAAAAQFGLRVQLELVPARQPEPVLTRNATSTHVMVAVLLSYAHELRMFGTIGRDCRSEIALDALVEAANILKRDVS